MKTYILALAFLTLTPMFANAQTKKYENEALALLQLAAAKQRMLLTREFPTYTNMCHAPGPLITFVGTTPRKLGDLQACYIEELNLITEDPGIVISKNGIWITTLPITATDAEIQNALIPKQQTGGTPTSSDPFSESQNRQGSGNHPRADGSSAPTVGLRYSPSHNCPNCGAEVTVISGRGPTRGTHIHVCPKDGTTWYH